MRVADVADACSWGGCGEAVVPEPERRMGYQGVPGWPNCSPVTTQGRRISLRCSMSMGQTAFWQSTERTLPTGDVPF